MNFFSMLSFTTPWLLAALAALPILWFLMRATPPSPARVKFPAFVLLRQLTQTQETPDKTPWWLLLLRLIAAALIIAALAGPILNAPPPSETKGPLLLVIDNSWAAAPGWRKRLTAIQLAAAQAEENNRPIFLFQTAPSLESPEFSPLTARELREKSAALEPQPFRSDRQAALQHIEKLSTALAPYALSPEIRWYTDGLSDQAIKEGAFTRPTPAQELATSLEAIGDLTVFTDDAPPIATIKTGPANTSGPAYQIERLQTDAPWSGDIIITARDGRELSRAPFEFAAGQKKTEATTTLPLALQNDIGAARIEGLASAAAVHLADARDRRVLVGIVGGDPGADKLLDGAYYIQRALEPFAAFETGTIQTLLESGVAVLMMDDIGRLRRGDIEALDRWIADGGVLIRFAGPVLAEASQDGAPALLPVSLRGGGRAFGGALTWETPQALTAFSQDGPFADLAPARDVLIRRQVLAAPGGETSLATWASLEDGTPLVTGARIGEGALTLFHVTATPSWSDLPISGVFIDMLRKLIVLSVLAPKEAAPDANDAQSAARFPPLRVLNGYGQLQAPPAELRGVTTSQADAGAAAGRPPGLYGSPDAPLAINTVSQNETLEPLTLPGITMTGYETTPPAKLAAPLFLIALLLLLTDAIASLALSGRLRMGAQAKAALAAGFTSFAATLMIATPEAHAQPLTSTRPLDAPIDTSAAEAALATRLAYIRTGDPSVDRISEAGLASLSRELYRRTAIEPAAPAGVDPETDDLSVYPFLYWPMTQGTTTPSETALTNIENFMRFGGLVMFDTRDDERAIAGLETPERAALRSILSQLDVPPLTPLPEDHVLKRSFYLLPDLPGRMRNNPIWVQAGGEANDAVTPLIIGGRDWAGAWAFDASGRPMLPLARGGPRARELAYRAGINVVMVAFTGNYKSDQVHTPILLERLGQ